MVQSGGKRGRGRRDGMGARQIYEALRDQIANGVYGPGSLLPSSRGLAGEFGVSRTTVTIAYDQLAAEGFIDVRQGTRPMVVAPTATMRADEVPEPSAKVRRLSAFGRLMRSVEREPGQRDEGLVADFRHGDLSRADFPIQLWKRAMTEAMLRSPSTLTYDDARGSSRLRAALQGYLWRARTLSCRPEQIIIVNGSQQGLDLCARLFLDCGDRFVIENPCYSMARDIFSATGAAGIPVPVDSDGLITERLPAGEARLAYVTPSHQFPLGGVMPVGRRRELLDWAARAGAMVIEDDYDSEFRYDINPVPPLHGLADNQNILYLGTISKTLSPALRIGYLVAPPDLADAFANAKQLTDRHSPLAEQEALASLIESGAYEAHVRRVRRRHAGRRATLLNALHHIFGDRVRVEGAEAGLHVVVWFRDLPSSRTGALIEAARRRSVGVHGVSELYGPHAEEVPEQVGLVMGYAALDIARIERGLQLLAPAVGEMRESQMSVTIA